MEVKIIFNDSDFKTILVPEDNEKQNPDESYRNKFQKYITCGYSYKIVCNDYKFSNPFKSYLSEDSIFNLINCMVQKSHYCSDVIKKLLMTKEDEEDY